MLVEGINVPTPGELRTDEEKETDAVVLARVKRGIALLEAKHGPGWVDHIDADTLMMSSGSRCVLGQLYDAVVEDRNYQNGFSVGINALGLVGRADAFGFDHDRGNRHVTYVNLQVAWLREIDERKAAR